MKSVKRTTAPRRVTSAKQLRDFATELLHVIARKLLNMKQVF